MSDLVFSPWPFPGHLVAPGSAEVIYLRRALFVLKGTYFDPVAQADAPLPRHRWVLVGPGGAFSEGNDSDADGISTIFEPTPTEGASFGPDDTWELLLVPLYDGHADSDVYATHGEAWIDVDAKTWVHGDDVRTSSQSTPYARLHTRRLLRLPLWSTRRKVLRGGGFVQSPPHASTFADTGELTTAQLTPHGSRTSPWVIAVDHGWHRSYVQLRMYDHAARTERAVPRGPLLYSARELSGNILGGSSVRLDDGSTYVLHSRPESDLSLMVYQLDTPRFARFALEDDALDEGGSDDHEMVGLLGTHYFLPRRWCSRSMEAWEGAVDASADVRKRFSEIRTKGTLAQPLCFHLDDVVPVRNDGQAVSHVGTRLALLDHDLAIRDQASNAHGLVPYSTTTVERFPLRAEETIFVRGQGQEKMTRVIEYDGVLFELRHSHVRGAPRSSHLVGARAAEPLVLARKRRKSTIALIDCRYLPTSYGGMTGKRAHVIVHVSCFVSAPAADRVAGDTTGSANEAQTVGVPLVEHLLHDSARIWDQRHPAHGNPADKKDYVALPAAGMSEGATVLRVRHLFGARPALDRAEVRTATTTHLQNIGIEVHPQAGRATGGDPMHLFLVFGTTLRAPPVDPHPTASRPYSFEPSGGTVSDRPDAVAERSSTIAHELGHSMELPDEYIERARPNSDLSGRLAVFSQIHDAYPYMLGGSSMMNGDYLPRLRYPWAQLATLHAQLANEGLAADHWFPQEGPFFPSYDTGEHGTIRYDLDYAGLGGGIQTPEWPLWERPAHSGRVGLSAVHLFPARRDESMMGSGFTPPSAGILTEPFDGILVVTTKLWFSFGDDIDDIDDRWEVMTDLGLPFHSRSETPHLYIDTPGATEFRKVIVLMQPRFEYGPSAHVDFQGNTAQRSDADLEVIVRGNDGRDRAVDRSAVPATVRIRDRDVSPWILRFAIDPAHWASRDKDDELGASDLQPVADWLGTTLGRAAGTLRSYG
ncbi:MAG: hypothetical protein AB1Z98_22595 [Nannocystaceae bacterium]